MPLLLNQFDHFLSDLSLARKHIPRDVNSLFRCIAEEQYQTQLKADFVRQEVFDFVRTNLPEEKTIQQQLEDLSTAVPLELVKIVSQCYKRPFIVYYEENPRFKSRAHGIGFQEKPIILAHSFMNGRPHFDLIITIKRLRYQAIAQSEY